MADWISATTLMLRSSFSARRRFLRTGIEQRQPAFHVGVDVRLAVLDFGRRRSAGRRSNSPARSPRRSDRFECRSWPPGRPAGRVGAATWAGSTNRTRVVPSAAANSRRKHSPSRSLRRTISCCRWCQRFRRMNSSSTACTSPTSGSSAVPAPGGHGPIGVAAADDVADAVLLPTYPLYKMLSTSPVLTCWARARGKRPWSFYARCTSRESPCHPRSLPNG